jgi:NAD+ kinase
VRGTPPFGRIALVVHPTRPIDEALETLRRWTAEHGIPLVQLPPMGQTMRECAPIAEPAAGDLIVALGGDGTVLKALRGSAALRVPVLGVACGSLGALSAVAAGELSSGLDRLRSGDWAHRSLPALAISATGIDGEWAVNDFVVFRGGAGQLATDVTIDGELYARTAGDGLIVATALGSTAYSMAAGGPILAAGTAAFVCTPLAMHGGCAPPLVVPASATVDVDVHPGYGGCKVEVDGDARTLEGLSFRFTLHPDRLQLVAFGPTGHGLEALRRRGLVADSPRILARDERQRPA